MRKKIISILLCLTLAVQSVAPALAEEFIVYDEADSEDTIVFEEENESDSYVESFGDDLIIDDGLFEDFSPEVSEGDGTAAGELIDGFQQESETEEALELESETEEELSETETEEIEETTEIEANQEIQETELESEAAEDNGAAAETETEGLIEKETESELEGLLESDPDEELEIITLVETVELADATVFSNPSFGGMRTFSLKQYNGCFGNQLSGFAREIYDLRVEQYVTNQNPGELVIERTSNTSPYTFIAKIYYDGTGGHINTETSEYTDFYNQIRHDMQASVDAFLYDHPEAFWLRSGSYSVSISAVGSSGSGYVGFLKNITYTPIAAYPGAASDILAYEAGVSSAVAQIMASADKDENNQTTNLELIKAIHDYLCERLYYDTAAYNEHLRKEAAGEKITDYHIFSSAGAFIDRVGKGVVCEGYAKGFKVLCDRMDIPCVLIGGKVYKSSGTEGHMWNGVKIDGKWYLMDVTWDDSSAEYSYNYFLIGNITDSRVSTGNFMGAELTTTFVYPMLETEAYEAVNDVIHTMTGEKIVEPTCSDKGYTEHFCTDEGCEYFYRDTYTAPSEEKHKYRSEITQPKCTAQGYTTLVCRLCGDSKVDETSYTEKLGHSYTATTVKPTCTEEGYTTYKCKRCSYSYTDAYKDATGHDYEAATVVPTCTEEGYTTYTCSNCEDTYTDDYTDINPNNHDYRAAKVVEPTCTEKGYTVYDCSRCDALKNDLFTGPNGHSYKSAVTAPTHQAKGYTTYTCTVSGCGYSYRGNEKAVVKNHTYKNGICSICGIGDTITKATISKISSQGYDPKGAKPEVAVKFGTNVLKKGTDYTVTYRNNMERGTGWVTITGKGKYRGTVSRSFEIVKKKAAKLTYSTVPDKTYTGKALKPTVTIRNNGTKLKKNTDYTVTYSQNKNIGQAVITVKFKGNYKGTKKIYFNILPKTVSLKSVKSTAKKKMKVTWKKVTGGGSYQIQYSLNSNFGNAKTVTVKTTSKTITGLTSKKTYYVRIRGYKKVSGKKYYSAWSKAKKVTIK